MQGSSPASLNAPKVMQNPYLDAYNAALEHEIEAGRTMAGIDKQPSGFCCCYECRPLGQMETAEPSLGRRELIKQYGFAVPNEDAIQAIKKLGLPVMEFGAGTGYWAWMLDRAGVEVMAFDLIPPGIPETQNGYGFTRAFFEVYPGDGPSFMEECSFCKDFALMLCWPEYEDSFAVDTLRAYQGDTLIYVGEDFGGWVANEGFFLELANEWTLGKTVEIPQWADADDRLEIYWRRG